MSKANEYLKIISEISLHLVVLREELNKRVPAVFLSKFDYQVIDHIRALLIQLEELDSE